MSKSHAMRMRSILNRSLLFSSFAALQLTLTGCSRAAYEIPQAPVANSGTSTCPPNYIDVMGNAEYGTRDFCLAKYEMKNVGGSPESQASGLPWSAVTRDEAKAACASKGTRYSLPDNNQWMTVSRDIESVAWNFGGPLDQQEYGISRGVSNNPGTTGVAASEDDNESCYLAVHSGGALASCDLQTYDVARRVNKLSNDQLIWDFAGNVSEWIADDMTESFATKAWILNIVDTRLKKLFGPAQTYPAGPTNPTGNIYMYNFGYLSALSAPPYNVMRGGGFSYGRYAGVFTAYMVPTTHKGSDVGFRCQYSKN